MIRFLAISVLFIFFQSAYAGNKYLSGYFVKKKGALFFSQNPDAILPSIKVKLSSIQAAEICMGGSASCREVQILCGFEINNGQRLCNVKKILANRQGASAELKIWNKFFF